jgi:PAS domain S-box-containing protein
MEHEPQLPQEVADIQETLAQGRHVVQQMKDSMAQLRRQVAEARVQVRGDGDVPSEIARVFDALTQDLLRASERTRLAEAAARGFIYEWSTTTGKTERSPALFDVLGYGPEEIDDDIVAWGNLIHPDDFAIVAARGLEGTAAQGYYALEYRVRHRQGHYVYVFDRGIVERDEEGNPLRVVGITTDISERRQAGDALQALNATLERRVAERTAELERANAELQRSNGELDRFAYVVSHDLKSPLRAVASLASWIEADAADVLPPAAKVHLDKLRGRVKRMQALLDDLLLFARAGRVLDVPEWVDPRALVQGIAELLNLPEGFQVQVAGDLPRLRCARPPFETVLRNLIGNAVKHHDRPQAGIVAVSARVEAGVAQFCVADNGPGIAPEHHARIFEIFQTLRPRDQVEGSGMGLAIAKKAVEAAGGRIWVESAPGEGAAFYFTWPQNPPPV